MKHTITLITGDGIGPEVTGAVVKILPCKKFTESTANRFFFHVPEHLGELGVDALNAQLTIDHDDGLWNAGKQLAEMCLLVVQLIA